MTQQPDVTIIGGGVTGASTLYHLASLGATRSLLLDSGPLAGGFTGRSMAILRTHYSNEVTSRFAWQSLEVFKNFDLSRVLFGSDHLMAGAVRGRYTEVGTFWVFVGKPDFDWGHLLYHQEPTYVIYEQLRAMGRAAKLLGLSKKQIRDIFWNNAIGLLKELRRAKKRAV